MKLTLRAIRERGVIRYERSQKRPRQQTQRAQWFCHYPGQTKRQRQLITIGRLFQRLKKHVYTKKRAAQKSMVKYLRHREVHGQRLIK